MAGKGDDYRSVNKKKFDATMDRIFGERDPMDYQKGCRGKLPDVQDSPHSDEIDKVQ